MLKDYCNDERCSHIRVYFKNIEQQIRLELVDRNITDDNLVSKIPLHELSFCLLRDFRKDFNNIQFYKDCVLLYVDCEHYIKIMYFISDRMCAEPICPRMYYEHGEQLINGRCILHQ